MTAGRRFTNSSLLLALAPAPLAARPPQERRGRGVVFPFAWSRDLYVVPSLSLQPWADVYWGPWLLPPPHQHHQPGQLKVASGEMGIFPKGWWGFVTL